MNNNEILYHELKDDYKFIVVDANNDNFSEKMDIIMQNLLTLDIKVPWFKKIIIINILI